jgi:ABC-type lipoprotein release transport system permease subunit
MMRSKTENGFVLFYLIALIALMSTSLLVLTSLTNTMATETEKAYLDASYKNLQASAKSWVSRPRNQPEQNSARKQRSLDCSQFQISNPQILMYFPDSKDRSLRIRCRGSYRKWRREKSVKIYDPTLK